MTIIKRTARLRGKRGFTLVECLVAIAVFSLMALIVMSIIAASLKQHQSNKDASRSIIAQREALGKNEGTVKKTYDDPSAPLVFSMELDDGTVVEFQNIDNFKRDDSGLAKEDQNALELNDVRMDIESMTGGAVGDGVSKKIMSNFQDTSEVHFKIKNNTGNEPEFDFTKISNTAGASSPTIKFLLPDALMDKNPTVKSHSGFPTGYTAEIIGKYLVIANSTGNLNVGSNATVILKFDDADADADKADVQLRAWFELSNGGDTHFTPYNPPPPAEGAPPVLKPRNPGTGETDGFKPLVK